MLRINVTHLEISSLSVISCTNSASRMTCGTRCGHSHRLVPSTPTCALTSMSRKIPKGKKEALCCIFFLQTHTCSQRLARALVWCSVSKFCYICARIRIHPLAAPHDASTTICVRILVYTEYVLLYVFAYAYTLRMCPHTHAHSLTRAPRNSACRGSGGVSTYMRMRMQTHIEQ